MQLNLNLHQLAEKVVQVVQPLREKLDAVLIFPSMPDVMRLNKVRNGQRSEYERRHSQRPCAGGIFHYGTDGSV